VLHGRAAPGQRRGLTQPPVGTPRRHTTAAKPRRRETRQASPRTFDKTSYNGALARFEAGTPNIADAVGLGAALEYVSSLSLENIARYEHELLGYATERLSEVPGL
jgi:selenocysteine lyase/cysteine desulfurase